MATFHEFDWDREVRDHKNNVAEFKTINIIYGRNYSGKTTLSRIIRAFETNTMPINYENPRFEVTMEDGSSITQGSLLSKNQCVRVYNEDFVKDRLGFVIDEEKIIKPFAVLGGDNRKIENLILAIKVELGGEEKKTGLYGKLQDITETYEIAKKNWVDAKSSLDGKLKDKANNADTGIKHNKIYGDANYNISRLKKDIADVLSKNYIVIDDRVKLKYHELLKEDPKQPIKKRISSNLAFEVLSQITKKLVEKKIAVSNPIKDLMEDALLQEWVREGRKIHKANKRKTCGFCGSPLPENLWEKIDKHFNEESEQLISEIDKQLRQIELENNHALLLLDIKSDDFYIEFMDEVNIIKEDIVLITNKYCESLRSLTDMLKRRKQDIFASQKYSHPEDYTKSLYEILDKYDHICRRSNDYTGLLDAEQKKARNALRLQDVYFFLADIRYISESKRIKQLEKEFFGMQTRVELMQEKINKKENRILELRAQLNDETKGAYRVNSLLNNYFGHKYLKLVAIKNESEGMPQYRFEIIRGEKTAYNLSKGECNLISFCYFIAKLEDVETKDSKPIIWIDDPVSSLDSNHIFFVYSLINSEILKKERYRQIFISTHNIEFLKYLKRLEGARNKRKSGYFIVECNGENSILKLMPEYLEKYVTEFIYLFHQIYKCANVDIACSNNNLLFYNFGNNARKFLEAYLYFKYPNVSEKEEEKLNRFFGSDFLSSSLANRINNEYSHLNFLERGIKPIDVPEMRSEAKFILEKIKENDIEQYNALLQSIGEEKIKKASPRKTGNLGDGIIKKHVAKSDYSKGGIKIGVQASLFPEQHQAEGN